MGSLSVGVLSVGEHARVDALALVVVPRLRKLSANIR